MADLKTCATECEYIRLRRALRGRLIWVFKTFAEFVSKPSYVGFHHTGEQVVVQFTSLRDAKIAKEPSARIVNENVSLDLNNS